MFCSDLSTGWLKSKAQLDELARKAREMFEAAAIRYPTSPRWHIFYAGPAPGGVVVGQQLNPTMIPTVQLYEFQRPRHIPSITITARDSLLPRGPQETHLLRDRPGADEILRNDPRPQSRRTGASSHAPPNFRQNLPSNNERLAGFALELHPEKTRLIEFGRFAQVNRQQRGEGKPEAFTFLGFTHYCSTDTKGHFAVRRRTVPQRMRTTLHAIKAKLRQRMHEPVNAVGVWLKPVVSGYYRYHALPDNQRALWRFRDRLCDLWRSMFGPS